MRNVDADVIAKTVSSLLIEANYELCGAERRAIEDAANRESDKTGKYVLNTLVQNLNAAKRLSVPICQDTGMAVIFAEVGQDVHIVNGYFEDAINKGVSMAYTDGYMRFSIVDDPLFERKNTNDNSPAVIHTRLVPGDKIKITAVPKGFGSENMSAVKMMEPSSDREDVIAFVTETVRRAGAAPCPPIFLGIGIGGTFEYAPFLAKSALMRGAGTKNENPYYAELENDILDRINRLGIGPQGFGGDITALGVNIEYYPTHIAGLPVAVNINCHAMRHKSAVI